MRKRLDLKKRIRALGRLLYAKIFRSNDSPQRIALGCALGTFTGIFPGTGPLVAIFLAVAFKANRAAALIAAFLTNTWLSILTLLLAVKLGAALFGIQWQSLQEQFASLRSAFSWSKLTDVSLLKVIVPVVAGYTFVAVCFGILVHFIVLLLLLWRRQGGFINKKGRL